MKGSGNRSLKESCNGVLGGFLGRGVKGGRGCRPPREGRSDTMNAMKIVSSIAALVGVVLSLNLSPAAANNVRPTGTGGFSVLRPQPVFLIQTRTSVQPNKARYQRGETVRVQAEAWIVRYDPAGRSWRATWIAPAPNAEVRISEKSNRGTRVVAGGRTDRQGRFVISYRVPTDSRTDNVRVCGWTMNEEPFEGTEVRIPIGR